MKNQNLQLNLGTLYEANQQLMNDTNYFKPLTHLELAAAQEKIAAWFQQLSETSEYVMLLCYDFHYFTIFHFNRKMSDNEAQNAAKECINCLKDIKHIDDLYLDLISIEPTSDNNWEIWFRNNETSYVSYLFNYQNGIIDLTRNKND